MRFNREPVLGPGEGDRDLRGTPQPIPVDLGIDNTGMPSGGGVSSGGVTGGPAQPPINSGGVETNYTGAPPPPPTPIEYPPAGGSEVDGGPAGTPVDGGLGGSGYELPGEPPPPVPIEPEAPSTGLPLAMPGGVGGSFAQPGTRGAIPFQPPSMVSSRSLRLGPGAPQVGAGVGAGGTGAPLGGGDPLAGLFDPNADDSLLQQILSGPGVRG